MSPTNLGALRRDQPLPTGLCQIKRGVQDVGVTYNNVTTPRPLTDASGGQPMRIGPITPARNGMWYVHAETIWMQVDAVWTYFYWGVYLTPADADGIYRDLWHCAQHSAQQWVESCITTAFRLNAGVAYYAEMYWPQGSSGYNQQHWTGGTYTYISGEFVEDGDL